MFSDTLRYSFMIGHGNSNAHVRIHQTMLHMYMHLGNMPTREWLELMEFRKKWESTMYSKKWQVWIGKKRLHGPTYTSQSWTLTQNLYTPESGDMVNKNQRSSESIYMYNTMMKRRTCLVRMCYRRDEERLDAHSLFEHRLVPIETQSIIQWTSKATRTRTHFFSYMRILEVTT